MMAGNHKEALPVITLCCHSEIREKSVTACRFSPSSQLSSQLQWIWMVDRCVNPLHLQVDLNQNKGCFTNRGQFWSASRLFWFKKALCLLKIIKSFRLLLELQSWVYIELSSSDHLARSLQIINDCGLILRHLSQPLSNPVSKQCLIMKTSLLVKFFKLHWIIETLTHSFKTSEGNFSFFF